MSSRKEEVLIYLQAIGAAQTRRDIESVARSLDKLDDKTTSFTKEVKENTEATETNTKARRASTEAVSDNTDTTNKARRVQKDYTDILFRQSRGYKRITENARAAIRLEKQRISALDAEAKLRDRLVKQQERQQRILERQRTLEYNRIVSHNRRVFQANERARKAESRAEAKALREQERRHRAAHIRLTRATSKMTTKLKGIGTSALNMLHFDRPLYMLKIATIIFGVLDLVPIVGTALNSLLAASIAAVNGLMPMLSLFGAIPAGLLAFTQLGVILAMITTSTSKFKRDIEGIIVYWKDLQKLVSVEFHKGMAALFREITQTYMPILNKQLKQGARYLNEATKEFGYWLTTKDGVKVISDLLKDNNQIIRMGTIAFFEFFKVFLRLGQAGSRVFKLILSDLTDLAVFLDNLVADRNGDLSDYFVRAYRSVKRAGRIVGNFLVALYNIFRLSAPLTKILADNLEKASIRLRKWTKSKAGVKAIKQYFADMVDPLKAIGTLAATLAKAIFNISRSKNFVSIVKEINDRLVPALIRIIEKIDGNFIRLVVAFVENIGELAANTAFIDALIDVGNALSDILGFFSKLYGQLDETQQKWVIYGLVIVGIFGNLIVAALSFLGALGQIGLALRGIQTARAGALGGSAGNSFFGVGGGGKPKRGSGKGSKKPAAPRRSAGLSPRGIGPGSVGLGALIGLPIGGAISNSIKSSVRDPGVLGALSGDLDSFFKGKNGKGIVGTSLAGNVNDLNTAMQRLATNGTKLGPALGQIVGGLTGAETNADRTQEAFNNLDTALTQMPADKSAALFRKIKIAAEQNGVKVQDLVDMFPQYRNQVITSVGPTSKVGREMQTAAGAARAMAGGISAIGEKINALSLTKITQINNEINETLGLNNRFGSRIELNYAGGTVSAGGRSIVGELGPEFGLTRSGRLSLYGANGPEIMRAGSETAIIPASATQDPVGGNYGNAPDWARMALQNSFDSQGGMSRLRNSKSHSEPSVTSHYAFDFSGATFGSGVDLTEVKATVMQAIKDSDRDRRERR